MPRLAFKPDSSFFRKIVTGAVGARAVVADLAGLGHRCVELERGSTDTKLWKDVKRKRVRIPDLVCLGCGARIECRAKTKLELAMSHTPTDAERSWDFGMVDSDLVAFPCCEVRADDEWSAGSLHEGVSYWREKNCVRWVASGRINYFSVAAFRSALHSRSRRKGAEEGSENTISCQDARTGDAMISSRLPTDCHVYSTESGLQACGDSRELLALLPEESVDLIVTSPPFALQRKKSYGNKEQHEYAGWLCEFGKAAHRVLNETGSFVLDLGGAYQKGKPVRSLYNFRVLLEFCDRLGYRFAEDFYWFNPAKLPSPIEWVNIRKMRAKDSVNTVWWFSKGDWPKADVTRVLTPYSERMKKLLKDPEAFYQPARRPSGHDISKGFGNGNGGAIPSNLLQIPNTDSNSHYLRTLKALDEDSHPARFPPDLPKFFIEFLTDPGDLVVDLFSGSNTTGRVAHDLGRRWLSIEIDPKYARLSAVRFLEAASLPSIRATLATLERGEPVQLEVGSPAQSAPPKVPRKTVARRPVVKSAAQQKGLF
jgi:site-specific DNA-methyltransferase (cytosine-N4-specific)